VTNKSHLKELLNSNSVPFAEVWQRFHVSSRVSKVQKPKSVFGHLRKRILSDHYAIHDNVMD